MHPIICQIGPLAIYSYGLMLAVAVVVCSFLLRRDARKKGLDPDLVYDLMFCAVVSGIIGARIFYLFLNLDFFMANPVEILMIHHGGLAWQGGLIGGTIASVIFVKRKKLSVPFVADLVAPYLALGQSIGRIGCFLNGCCYGKEVAWGIFFPAQQAHLHPTQLYATFNLFVIFLILKQAQKHNVRPGQVFVLYLILAGVERFIVEFFRADHEIFIFGLSIFQVVSLGVFCAGVIGLFFLSNFSKKNT